MNLGEVILELNRENEKLQKENEKLRNECAELDEAQREIKRLDKELKGLEKESEVIQKTCDDLEEDLYFWKEMSKYRKGSSWGESKLHLINWQNKSICGLSPMDEWEEPSPNMQWNICGACSARVMRQA